MTVMLADAGPSLRKLVTVISYFTLPTSHGQQHISATRCKRRSRRLTYDDDYSGGGRKEAFFFFAPLCSPGIFFHGS